MVTSTFHKIVRSDKVIILFLCLLTLVVRLIALERIYLIARDGIHYVSLSRAFLSGSIVEGLSHPYHPLYPVFMALGGGIIGDVELAGQLINLMLSSLTIIPLYFIGKSVYGWKGGTITGLFFAFQPYCVRFSVDVLSEPSFLFFFVLALYLGLQAGGEGKDRKWWSLGAGLSGGLAYLTRPEGILIIGFLLGWYFWRSILYPRRAFAHFSLVMGFLLLAFFLLAAPYLLFIKNQTGSWRLSMKPSVSKVFKISTPENRIQGKNVSSSPPAQVSNRGPQVLAPAKPQKSYPRPTIGKSITHPLLKFIETYHYLLFLFLVIGILLRDKQDGGNVVGVLAGFLLVYVLCLFYLYHVISYVSRRHFIPPLVMSLPLAALGFWEVKRRISAWAENFSYRWNTLFTNYAALVLVFITVLTLMPKALKSQRADKLPLKEAAVWINENCPKPSPLVMSNEPLVAYYAGGKHIYIPALSYENLTNFIRNNHVDFLVLGEEEIRKGTSFLGSLRAVNFRKVYSKDRKSSVYEVFL